jgi:hypothetical protein
VVVPESLLDDSEGLEGLPFIQYFYRYLPGGYSLSGIPVSGFSEGSRKPKNAEFAPRQLSEKLRGLLETVIRESAELHHSRESEKIRLSAHRERVLSG